MACPPADDRRPRGARSVPIVDFWPWKADSWRGVYRYPSHASTNQAAAVTKCKSAHACGLTFQRRLFTIIFLLLPTIITSPSMLNYLKGQPGDDSFAARVKARLAKFLESPLGQSLPEIHLVLFMFRGTFYEAARRFTGLTYVSAPNLEPANPNRSPISRLVDPRIAHRLMSRWVSSWPCLCCIGYSLSSGAAPRRRLERLSPPVSFRKRRPTPDQSRSVVRTTRSLLLPGRTTTRLIRTSRSKPKSCRNDSVRSAWSLADPVKGQEVRSP